MVVADSLLSLTGITRGRRTNGGKPMFRMFRSRFVQIALLTVLAWLLAIGLFLWAYADVYARSVDAWTFLVVIAGIVLWVASMVLSKRATRAGEEAAE